MKTLLALIAATLLCITAQVSAQSGAADPYAGTWKLNSARTAAAWKMHPQPKIATPAPRSFEVIDMKIAGGTLTYAAEYASANEPHKKAGFTAAYNNAKWQNLEGSNPEFTSFTLIKTADRVRYVVTRGKDGQFAGLILHRLSDDGRSLTAVDISAEGVVRSVRVFDKQ